MSRKCPSHRLQVLLRVPVAVEEDARVGGLQVDAEAARARRHEEEEDLGAGRVEGLQVDHSLHPVRRAYVLNALEYNS